MKVEKERIKIGKGRSKKEYTHLVFITLGELSTLQEL